jgi:hypothetical protein
MHPRGLGFCLFGAGFWGKGWGGSAVDKTRKKSSIVSCNQAKVGLECCKFKKCLLIFVQVARLGCIFKFLGPYVLL